VAAQDAHPRLYIAIGASGREGLEDIQELLAALSHPLRAIMLVVLHRPADRPSVLRQVLARATRIPVRIAAQGETLEEGAVYIGEPAQHLTMLGKQAELVADERTEHRNRTIDLLLHSIAAEAGTAAVGIVLSGLLDDGARGLEAVHKAGGVTMVLTPERDRPPEMPENAIDFDGPINVIGSPTFIAAALEKLIANSTAPRTELFRQGS
jgi:two-component system chemotaxis response regulator CheB